MSRATFPIPDPQSPEAIEAARLHSEWRRLVTDAARVEQDRTAAQHRAEEATKALRDHLTESAVAGTEDKARARALEKAAAAARAAAHEPWADRIIAINHAAALAERAVQAHIDASFNVLLDEIEPAAQAAAQRLSGALQSVADAFEGWRRAAADARTLIEWTSDRRLMHPAPIPEHALTGALDWEALASLASLVPLPHPTREAMDRRAQRIAAEARDETWTETPEIAA